MLRTLSVRDFVIVDSLELEFASGFSVLTGETGAGKSILIDALALALGGRGDAGMIREGATKADISAEFGIREQVGEWLVANEMNGDDGSLLLRRVIDSAGRSRGFINGFAATTSQMREVGEMLVDIHGQHAHQSLLRTDGQRMLLDRHAGLLAEADTVASAYRVWQALEKQRREFETNARSLLMEKERLEWQVGELEKLAVKPGEWHEINNEHSRLAHAASLIEGVQEAISAVSEAEQPIVSRLYSLQQKLAKLSDIDPALQPVTELLDSARIQLQEATYELTDYLSHVELDPERLSQVEARLEAIHSAGRRFRVAPEDLPSELDELSSQLKQLANVSDMEALRKREDAASKVYFEAAQNLSRKRTVVAKQLSDAVTVAMQDLSMAGGRFAVALNPCEPGIHGIDQVEFMVAGHAGTALRPLTKVASGGELARISLAISVITSSATATPTLIFDEVDSGIGGAVAEVVGRLLKRLGQEHQVLCVTHLPQVASQASQHFQVSKTELSGKASAPVSRIAVLDPKDRVEEIARMLGGIEITATTRRHARELLAL
jgi:DNA repair protein RecN (Recombination protein N)